MYKKILLTSFLFVGSINGFISCSTNDIQVPSLEQLATHACIASLKTPQGMQAIGQSQIPNAVKSILTKNLCTTYLLPE